MYVEPEMQAFLLDGIMSKMFWFSQGKNPFRFHGVVLWDILNLNQVLEFIHTSPMTDPEFILFCFP